MSLWPKVPSIQQQSFSFYLDHAATAGGKGHVVIPSQRGSTTLRTAAAHLRSGWLYCWRWLQMAHKSRTATRRLLVTETVSLGEKRFVSIVHIDDTQFLIGGSATSLQLLAQLESRSHVVSPLTSTTRESA